LKKITIAIDGFSSTGKSTIAKQLATKLHYIYVDTGAMYRAVACYALNNQIIVNDVLNKEKLVEQLDQINLAFKLNSDTNQADMILNDVNIEKNIRTLEVSNWVSQVASISEVRKKLVHLQQNMGKSKGVVMDGRDIGTVVFPDAELKIFMTASAETRAKRRFQELTEKGQQVTYLEVFNNIKQRDQMDTSRADSPLVKAEDAIELDNSDLSLNEQFLLVMGWIDKLIQ
jgi:cytidylate kinase